MNVEVALYSHATYLFQVGSPFVPNGVGSAISFAINSMYSIGGKLPAAPAHVTSILGAVHRRVTQLLMTERFESIGNPTGGPDCLHTRTERGWRRRPLPIEAKECVQGPRRPGLPCNGMRCPARSIHQHSASEQLEDTWRYLIEQLQCRSDNAARLAVFQSLWQRESRTTYRQGH